MKRWTQEEHDFFRRAFCETLGESDPVVEQTETYHPADDLVFLESLASGMLDTEERRHFIEHLADCPHCRKQTVLQVKCGALFTEDASREVTDPSPSESVAMTSSGSRKAALPRKKGHFLLLGTAAAVLVATIGLLWSSRDDRSIELARREIEVVRNADGISDDAFSPRLTDFGYRLSGKSMSKGLLENVPETSDQYPAAQAYEKLLKLRPADRSVRLEYVRYLLVKRIHLDRAHQILESMEPLPNDPQLDLLAGLCCFLQNNDQDAQDHFLAVLQKEPNNETALLNLAVSLSRSGQTDEALDLYRRLYNTSISDTLKLQIDIYLQKNETR